MTTTRKVDRRERDIKKKLSAAVIMLLLSCIMVVTSTYAWFTLSTAPEVTGISTTIGGNGNLEIALAGYDDDGKLKAPEGSTTTDGAQDTLIKNLTWGNLVDLSNVAYGLNNIVLKPSALNVTKGTGSNPDKVITSSMLSVPSYGPDGRINEMLSQVSAGVYGNNTFTTKGYGVRGLGVSSSKTERQFAYSGALSNINANMASAEAAVENALSTNGPALTQIAIGYGMNKPEFTFAEVRYLQTLITSTQSALPSIEKSIVSFIDATLASDFGKRANTQEKPGLGIDDETYKSYAAVLKTLDIDDEDVVSVTGETISLNLVAGEDPVTFKEATLANAIKAYQSVSEKLSDAADEAQTLLTGANEDSTFAADDLKSLLDYIMMFDASDVNDTKVTVEGLTLGTIKSSPKDHVSTLGSGLWGTGLDINLNEGSGVYYDIASLIGELSSRFTTDVDVEYQGVELTAENATIIITSKPAQSAYFDTIVAGIELLGSPSAEGAANSEQIDDLYAFALDLYFRTNAADSNLLLQTTPTNRIYEDSSNSETMGNGSSMTFTFDSSLSNSMVKRLLSAINIVFMSEDGTVLSYAKLDSTNAVIDGYSVTANIYLTDENGALITDEKQGVIRGLDQNAAHMVTTLVYLDGNTVTNADVATAATSMTGTMNLQFASSAELEAMDYTALQQGDVKEDIPTMTVNGSDVLLSGLATDKTYTITYPTDAGVQTLQVSGVNADGKATVSVADALGSVAKNDTIKFTLNADGKEVTSVIANGTKS